jgi:hypothetical protein
MTLPRLILESSALSYNHVVLETYQKQVENHVTFISSFSKTYSIINSDLETSQKIEYQTIDNQNAISLTKTAKN